MTCPDWNSIHVSSWPFLSARLIFVPDPQPFPGEGPFLRERMTAKSCTWWEVSVLDGIRPWNMLHPDTFVDLMFPFIESHACCMNHTITAAVC